MAKIAFSKLNRNSTKLHVKVTDKLPDCGGFTKKSYQ